VAKGKPTTLEKTASTPAARRTPAGTSRGRASAAGKTPSTSAAGTLAADEIGHVAGEVWHLLNTKGELSLAAVKKSVGAPSDLVLAAIGWLAREGKLSFSASGRSVKVALSA